MPSPTALSLKLLRRGGYLAEVVEKWLPVEGKKIRRDLFRVADVLAVNPRSRTMLLVQATSLANVSARLAKARSLAHCGLAAWLRAGGKFEIWGWVRHSKRWRLKRVELTGEDLAVVVLVAPPRRDRKKQQPTLFEE